MSEDTEINEAELLEETEIMIKGGKSHGSAANCDIQLTSKNISWTYDNGVYDVKIFKFPLNDISLKLVPPEKGIFSNQKTQLSIIKKNNTNDTDQWNKWRIFFDSKFNSELKELLEHFKVLKEQKLKSEHYNRLIAMAQTREEALDYDAAIQIWEKLGDIKGAARVRRLKTRQKSVRVAQKVVKGNEINRTEIKDSVLNRSNVGGGSSKMKELRELKEMFDSGFISKEEMEDMKKEILGK